MPNLTCPLPANINPLSPNGFNFSISKLPEVSFFCQEVNLPGISTQTAEMNTPFSLLPFAGDIITYEDLQVQFLVDENMLNYTAIYNWLIGLGFPEDNKQFSDFTNNAIGGYSRTDREFSDATLQILGSNNQPVKSIHFIDILPINLSTLTFQSTNTDVNYLVGSATFKISRYNFI